MMFIPRFVLLIVIGSSIAYADTIENQLEYLTTQLSAGEAVSNIEQAVHVKSMVSSFYRLRQYKPAWDNDQFSAGVLNALAESFNEGLQPEDYHYTRLLTLYNKQEEKSTREQAEFELLMTDGVLLYALHLIYGKVDPANLEDTWNYKKRKLLPEKIIAELEALVERGTVVSRLDALKPNIAIYKKMRDELAFYRKLQSDHPFVAMEVTPLLNPGDQAAVVPQLRNRLREMRFTEAGYSSQDVYDEELLNAVKSFQEHHSLDADGVVGKNTWQALNMSWQDRIDKLRVNLERTRWVYENATDDFVLVNIAGFTLYMFEDRQVVWKTEVMTGSVKTETPVFMSRFSYMEFNPIWTVPRSILQKSLINKMKSNPQYIEDHDFVLYDRQGKAVDITKLDWAAISVNNFPYTVVQQPGEHNAMGRVKFMFPNSHAIYLHDTPSKSLFSRTARAFSHGCVRVQNPMEFARLLLNNPEKWNDQAIADLVASKKRTRVNVDRPTEVMLMYWTTEPSADGIIKFNPDIYNRDPGVLLALNELPE